jgi:outer membrane protein
VRRALEVWQEPNKEFSNRMKRVPAFAAVPAAAVAAVFALGTAQIVSAQAATAPAAAAAPAPTTAKVAVIAFQAAVTATNEFQRDYSDVLKKFEPKKNQLQQLGTDVDTLTKQLQAQGDKLTDAERASRARAIDDKKKEAQRLAEDTQNDFGQAVQETFGKVAAKVDDLLLSYSKQNGYTLVIDGTQGQDQAPTVLYAAPSTDITKAIVDAYNTKSGVPAPPPSAPNAPAPQTTRPAAKTPQSN